MSTWEKKLVDSRGVFSPGNPPGRVIHRWEEVRSIIYHDVAGAQFEGGASGGRDFPLRWFAVWALDHLAELSL